MTRCRTPEQAFDEAVAAAMTTTGLPSEAWKEWRDLPPSIKERYAVLCEVGCTVTLESGRTYTMYAHACVDVDAEAGFFWLGVSLQPRGDYQSLEEGEHVFNFDRSDSSETFPTPALAFARGMTLLFEEIDTKQDEKDNAEATS